MFEPTNRGNMTLRIAQGSTAKNVVLVCGSAEKAASVEISGSGVTLNKIDDQPIQGGHAFFYDVDIATDAELGDRSILVTNPDGAKGPAVFGMLEVVTKSSLGSEENIATARDTPAPDRVESLGYKRQLFQILTGAERK